MGSVPHVELVVFDSVFGEKSAQLFLVGLLLVVFFLGVDVMPQGVEIRWADGERGVASLPRKGGEGR